MLRPSHVLVFIVCNYYFLEITGTHSLRNIVVTENGKVQGSVIQNDKYKYIAFLGIPYAAAMTGKNRFKAPLPVTPWHGVYKADTEIDCPEYVGGTEDCLVLNVFTPRGKLVNDTYLPVLVLIHGGNFGHKVKSERGEEHLVRKGVIVVKINYRLGALGFLCLHNDEAPGNAGLKDQVAALKWVQKNIINFGGDPKSVTIFGVGAGAVSAHLLVLSKMGKGLFQKAIIDGGSALHTWAIDYDPISTAKDFAASLNFTANTTRHLATFYQSASNFVLNKDIKNYHQYSLHSDRVIGFLPCVEQPLDGVEAIITEHPLDILQKMRFKVPTLFSFATYEGIAFTTYEKGIYDGALEDLVPLDLEFESNEERTEIANKIKETYIRYKTDAYVKFLGDFLVTYGMLESARLHSNFSTVYLMEFALSSTIGPSYDRRPGHSAFYHHTFPSKLIKSKRDRAAVAVSVSLTKNFAKFGNPTPKKSVLLPVVWPPVKSGEPMTYLSLDNKLMVMTDPYKETMEIWHHMYENFQRRRMEDERPRREHYDKVFSDY